MSAPHVESKNRILARNKMEGDVNDTLVDALSKCVRYLADLNGCEWIKGDDLAAIDMRSRAKGLQSTAFSALEAARNNAGRLLMYGRCPGSQGDYSEDEYFVALYDNDGMPARKDIAVPLAKVAEVFGSEVAEFIKTDRGRQMSDEYPANYRMATFVGRFAGEPSAPSMLVGTEEDETGSIPSP